MEPRVVMSTTVKAIYEEGVFKAKQPVSLAEHAEVDVLIPAPAAASTECDEDDPTGWKAIDELIGSFKGGRSDVAENHDRYLYGDPDD